MSHDVVVTNCCRHGPVWYSNETHNLDQYLCYKSQMILSYYLWTRVCKFQINLQLYVYMYLERRYMYTYFEKVNIVFHYIM